MMHYSIEDLMASVPKAATLPAPYKRERSAPQFQDGSLHETNSPGCSFEPIMAGCTAVADLAARASELTYDEWLTLARILSRCDGGEDQFHRLSREDARYEHGETQRKYEEAARNMLPPTCGYLRSELSSTSCSKCALQHTCHSPMALARMAPGLASLFGEFVLDVSTQRFISLRNGNVYDEKAFRARFGHVPESKPVTSLLIQDDRTGKVERVVYRPGVEDRVLEDNTGFLLNVWNPGGVDPQPGEHPMIDEHLSLLVPDDAERDHILDYLSCLVQRMDQKLKHLVLIIGQQGIGKSFLGELIRKLLGDHNVYEIPPDQAGTKYRAAWGNRQAIVLEELMAGDRLQFQNEIKPWITQEEVQVEEKHIKVHSVATPRGWFAFSNCETPTIVAKDDRRFFVVRSPMQPMEAKYYDALWSALETEAPAFKYALMTRDISTFNPSAQPPMTAAKRFLVEQTKPPLELEIASAIDERRGPFDRSLVNLTDVTRWLLAQMPGQVRRQAVINAMKACGCQQRSGQVELENGSRPRLWAVRDHEAWLNCSAEAVREEMKAIYI